MRVGGYVRCSTEEQVKGLSLETQRGLISEFCEGRGWVVVGWFEDAGFSGAEDWTVRRGLMDLLNAAANKEFDVVVCLDTDRLSRDEYITASVKRFLQRNGILLTFCRFPLLDNTPHSQFAIEVKEAYDRLERAIIRARVKESMSKAKKEGKWVGNPPWGHRIHRCSQLGHKPCPLNGTLEVADPKVHEIRRLAEANMPITQIAKLTGVSYFKVYDLLRRGQVAKLKFRG
ncbi:MAG: recombinase family protein [Nitrososphaerales archaeon]